MIAPSVVQEIQRLLAEGKWSGRKIARVAGVSRGTVAAIAHGRRPDYEALRREREELEEPLGPLARCSGCGGMVHLPCRLCSVRRRQAQSKPRPRLPGPEGPLQLALLGDHQTRYEETRRRRIAAERMRTGWEEGEE